MKCRTSFKARSLILVPALLITISACSDRDPDSTTTLNTESTAAKAEFETYMDSIVAEPNVINTMVSVSNGKQSGSYSVARGEAEPGIPMTADHQFHIASMTKPFTATVLLQLVEEGNFSLDTPLSTVFGDSTMADIFPSHNFTLANPDGIAVADMKIDQLQTFGGQLAGGDIVHSIGRSKLAERRYGFGRLPFTMVRNVNT